MNYTTFQTHILEAVNSRLPAGLSAYADDIMKNNGFSRKALFLKEHPAGGSPVVYLSPYYTAYEGGMPEDRIAETIAAVLLKPLPENFDIRRFLDFDLIRPNIVYRLVSRKQNEAQLPKIVNRDHLDLSLTYGIYLPDDLSGGGISVITEALLEKWDVDEAKLYDLAAENTPKLMPEKIVGIDQLLRHETPGEAFLTPEEAVDAIEPSVMYVLSNRQNFYGASTLLYSSILPLLAHRLGGSLFILPSSVHELIITAEGGEDGRGEFLKELVRDICEKEGVREDYLSDTVYYFNAETGQTEICPQ